MTALMWASLEGHTEVVKLLLDKGALLDEKNKGNTDEKNNGNTALMWASRCSHTEVVRLLLDTMLKRLLEKGASLHERDTNGRTLLMYASHAGDTKLVKKLLDDGAPVDENNNTALMWASVMGRTDVVQLLLDKGVLLDVKDKDGRTALMLASEQGHTEVVELLLDKGALFDAAGAQGDAALLVLAGVDEDHLGRMAAAQVCRPLLQPGDERDVPASSGSEIRSAGCIAEAEVLATAEATGTAVLNLVRLAGSAAARARKLRSSDPRSADDHQALFGRLQLAAAACIQNDELGKVRGEKDVQKLFDSKYGSKALAHAVEIGAKELLAQPVVQGYMKAAWRGEFVGKIVDGDTSASDWVLLFFVLLLQLLFILPLVALVPALELWFLQYSEEQNVLRLPVVKFGLECAADLALALALTLTPAADLATAPVAPLLLIWVGSALLWEAQQVMAFSSDASTLLARLRDRFAAYWADYLNRFDATALIFSFAALVASLMSSTDDSERAIARSLRVVAVFLLWLRLFRVPLLNASLGPYVLIFFRMLFGDLLNFLVLLLVLLVAFTASWTVLLEPEPSLLAQQSGDEQAWRETLSPVAYLETAGCADELGGVDFFSTLKKLIEGALTGNDFFECARDSTESPWAAWALSLVFVTLTSVLLLNMLIAMCAACSHTVTPCLCVTSGSHRTLVV